MNIKRLDYIRFLRISFGPTSLYLALASAFTVCVALLWTVAPANPPSADPNAVAEFLPFYDTSLHPEPRDRFMYVTVSFSLAIIAVIGAMLARSFPSQKIALYPCLGLFFPYSFWIFANKWRSEPKVYRNHVRRYPGILCIPNVFALYGEIDQN